MQKHNVIIIACIAEHIIYKILRCSDKHGSPITGKNTKAPSVEALKQIPTTILYSDSQFRAEILLGRLTTYVLLLIAHAQLTSADYGALISTFDKILAVSVDKNAKIEALNLKREAYIEQADIEKIAQVNDVLKDVYGVVGTEPALPKLGSPILQYLP